MHILCWDTETSYQHPNPWDDKSYAVSLGLYDGTSYFDFIINHKDCIGISAEDLKRIQIMFDEADLIIGQNIKFDLHWLRKLGIKLKDSIRLYDTMIAEYLIMGQSTVGSLSLEDLSNKYLDIPKDDKVAIYWNAGYETDEIPLAILLPYMKRDVLNTFSIYEKQQPLIKQRGMERLIRLQCELAGVVEDMEWNGMLVDTATCKEKEQACYEKINELNQELVYFTVDNLSELSDIPVNWSSGDHLSTILFGGILIYDGVEPTQRTLKDGTIKHGTRQAKLKLEVTGLGFKPAKGTEVKKEGYYQTDKAQLEQLRAKTPQQKRFLEITRELSSAEKMSSTYFKPFQEESYDSRFHARFNQCSTVTGRLTCSRLHQIPRDDDAGVKGIFISEFS